MTINAQARAASFADYVRGVSGDTLTEEQLTAIIGAHAADVQAAEAFAEGMERDCKTAIRDTRMHVSMLSQMRQTISDEAYRSAEIWARMQLAEGILGRIRDFCDLAVSEAGDGVTPKIPAVTVAEISYAMAEALQPIERKPLKLAYVTDHRYTAGQFTHQERGDAGCQLPFVGWLLLSEVPQEDCIQPVFYVNGTQMIRDDVRRRHGLILTSLLT